MTIREKIDELLDLGNLTKWEANFLENLSDKVDRAERPLTEGELEKLEEIYRERT